ncbi:hypothetical protein INT48_007950 [Thamnidium elegans]|uniref:Cytochrome P450 n=1 Tax=Thamnidium elegans TaxID=101142 RepID=A0A8H7SR50_9FUNG|nr:hypothetical protein INT48_007950 [Thamnidium elegans]
MNYFGTIHKAVQLIRQLTVSHQLTDIYQSSSQKQLCLWGITMFFALHSTISYIKQKRQKLNLPPIVPFGLPLIGHSLYLALMPHRYLDWCNKNYGELYDLNIRGKRVTIANGKMGEEVLKADTSELSLDDGLLKDSKTLGLGTSGLGKIAKFVIPNPKIPGYIPGIQTGLNNGTRALLTEKVNVIQNPSEFFQDYISYVSVPNLLGQEFSLNKDVLHSFASFTGDIIKNIPIFLLVPRSLHPLVLPYVKSSSKHKQVMEMYIPPVVLERREVMKRAAEAGLEHHGLEDNILQGLIEFVQTDDHGNKLHYSEKELAQLVLLIAFASLHSTSLNLSFCIYWLLARPDLEEKLIKEIEMVFPGDQVITEDGLNRMSFLNNFLREVLRQGASNLSMNKKAMQDYTFSNGYQIPKGSQVETCMRQLNFGTNETRSKIEDMNPEMSQNLNATAPAKDFASFGMGKHLCPGRFFATLEIKMTLIYLLKKFDITTVSGKRPKPCKRLLGIRTMNSEDPLIFTAKK